MNQFCETIDGREVTFRRTGDRWVIEWRQETDGGELYRALRWPPPKCKFEPDGPMDLGQCRNAARELIEKFDTLDWQPKGPMS